VKYLILFTILSALPGYGQDAAARNHATARTRRKVCNAASSLCT
jgi:hypothetical protein